MSFRKQPDGRIACTCEPIRQEVVCLAKTQKQEAKTRIRGRLFFLLARGQSLLFSVSLLNTTARPLIPTCRHKRE